MSKDKRQNAIIQLAADLLRAGCANPIGRNRQAEDEVNRAFELACEFIRQADDLQRPHAEH